MHGELLKGRCIACGKVSPWLEDIEPGSVCPACGAGGWLRPHVVWFGEPPLHLDAIHAAVERCELFLAIGTSGVVWPAAGLVAAARRAHAIELNLEPSAQRSAFAELRRGPAATLVPALVDELLSSVDPS
jgi:NAD-dependent deacetylase